MGEKAIPGGHKARKTVKSYAERMAADDVLPAQYLGHASTGFVLGAAINAITALFLSRNYNLIPHQISLAYRTLSMKDWHDDVGTRYRSLAMDYLRVVSRYLHEFIEIERSESLMIPKELLEPTVLLLAPPEIDD
jgi:hypothetical protein